MGCAFAMVFTMMARVILTSLRPSIVISLAKVWISHPNFLGGEHTQHICSISYDLFLDKFLIENNIQIVDIADSSKFAIGVHLLLKPKIIYIRNVLYKPSTWIALYSSITLYNHPQLETLPW